MSLQKYCSPNIVLTYYLIPQQTKTKHLSSSFSWNNPHLQCTVKTLYGLCVYSKHVLKQFLLISAAKLMK